MNISLFITILGVLVALTNIVVEVTKKATRDKLPTNILALVIGELLSIVGGFAYLQIEAIPFVWYYIAAFIILGFMVAYAAMFGFDKLKETMDWNKKDTGV